MCVPAIAILFMIMMTMMLVGMVAMVLIGCGSGALAIIAQRTLWRSMRSGI